MARPSGRGTAQSDFELDHQLLAQSGIFDTTRYVGQAGPESQLDPIGHYLLKGWQMGLEPNESFPGSLLRPYFLTAGFESAPAITWVAQRAAGWPIPTNWNDVQWAAMKVRATGLFDERFYLAQFGKALDGLDPAIHYLIVGERMGFAPSLNFDPSVYMGCYPDVTQAGFLCLLHYSDHGRKEGRVGVAPKTVIRGAVSEDPSKENVILVVHETSRTGAPVLGWNIACKLAQRYNLYTVRMGDGELTPEFKAVSVELHGPFLGAYRFNPLFVSRSLRDLFDSRKFSYAIVNSIESRHVLESCARQFIPTLLLMHEFSTAVYPASSLYAAFDWATEIIFPARLVQRSAEDKYEALKGRQTRVIAQGASLLPERKASGDEKPNQVLEKLTRKHDSEGTFIVLGAGGVQIRKGVDLFLSAAAEVARSHPKRSIHFVWVGHGYYPEDDLGYSAYLFEQINRSGLVDMVTFLDAVPDLAPVYKIADAFLLTSRLDPFPNVAIDAIALGIPMVCFKEASGTAELLLGGPETAAGVVDYMDANAAGRAVLELAGDEALRKRVSSATRTLAKSNLVDMGAYVSQLDSIGTESHGLIERRSADAETLGADDTFDQDMFLGLNAAIESRVDTIARYLVVGTARGPLFKHVRRPAPGFHRALYAAEHAETMTNGVDPLADFVRKGKPPGRWHLPVLRPDDAENLVCPSGYLRVALHAHFYYPELSSDFLAHMESNRTPCDLFISTDGVEKAEHLKHALGAYKLGKVVVRVVPNRGRDIGPLLTEFSADLADYDVVGHVHAKRSLIVSDHRVGESWRQFLWQNLLGGKNSMLDRIVAAFERQERLGLVFPSDPHVISWDENKVYAAEIARRMGRREALPDHFDFPLGTMFWMRRKALQPLLELHLRWDDYPVEPLPYDGTILHAIERLMPFVCEAAGYQSAVTHVFGVSW